MVQFHLSWLGIFAGICIGGAIFLVFFLLQSLNEKSGKMQFYSKKNRVWTILAGSLMTVAVTVVLAFSLGYYTQYGDFSQRCQLCENESVWKLHADGNSYYCEEHEEDMEEFYDLVIYYSKKSAYADDTNTCSTCGKTCMAGQQSYSSIKKTGMCVGCYSDYKILESATEE